MSKEDSSTLSEAAKVDRQQVTCDSVRAAAGGAGGDTILFILCIGEGLIPCFFSKYKIKQII
jgi:hypothetical protein